MSGLKLPKLPSKATLARVLSPKARSPMLVTLSGIITVVRSLVEESRNPNGRNAVPDGHAGEDFVATEGFFPNGSNAVSDGHTDEVVLGKSTLPNGRYAVLE